MVTLANGFAERGLIVDLVLAKAEGPYLSEVDKRVRVVDLRSSRVVLCVPKLYRYLRKERPHAMLSAMTHANVVLLLARKLAGVSTKVVVSERNTITAASIASEHSRATLIRFLAKFFYRESHKVVAVSSGAADSLVAGIGVPRKHVYVIYNPVVNDKLLYQSRLPVDHPWLAPGEPPVIMGAGRLSTAKDFSTLIRAFEILRLKRSARLVILGEGELRPMLEEQIKSTGLMEYVSLPGFVNNPFAWMKKASLFVLSSAWEGLPGALIQAMACGVPVVSTDCFSGPAEILENGRWGRLVPVGDAPAMAAAMDAALNDKMKPDTALRAAYFGVQQAIDKYLDAMGISK